MLGLFGTLNMGARSLQVQRQGIEVAGHNLANVNNPAYARQRVSIVSAPTIPTILGPQGTGAQVEVVRHVRNQILDGQIVGEKSVGGFFQAQQRALEYGQSVLGEAIDRQTSGPEGSSASLGVGGQHGIGENIADLFNAFQSLSTNPSSPVERQAVLVKAESLASQMNQIDGRLAKLHDDLNKSVEADVADANELLAAIAHYNKQIIRTEAGAPGTANDLRDQRQAKLEELARLVNVQAVEQEGGGLDISISGVLVVSGPDVEEQLEAYDDGSGRLLVRAQSSGTPLDLTGGSLQGTIDARDGALAKLRTEINELATALITEVNAIHRTGYSLTGSTGADFFVGTNAADIAVNPALRADPSLLQASAVPDAAGDNQVAVRLAQLAQQRLPSLGNQTFSEKYARLVSDLGTALVSANEGLGDQQAVEQMLLRQRDAVSGVSLDEEMTDLIRFQKAFEASAKIVVTVDEMLQTVLSLKR